MFENSIYILIDIFITKKFNISLKIQYLKKINLGSHIYIYIYIITLYYMILNFCLNY